MTDLYTLLCEWDYHARRSHPEHTIRQLLDHVLEREHRIMASLDNLTAALDALGSDIATEATDVEAKLQELLDAIAALSVGAITQAQIDDLTAKATAADDAVKAVDDAAKAATPPTP